MAYTQVVTQGDLEALQRFLRTLEGRKGKLTLALLLRDTEEFSSRWNLIVSARWIDNTGPKTVVSYVSELLTTSIQRKTLNLIGRISPLSSHDSFVESFGRAFHQGFGAPRHVQRLLVGDFFIPEAYLFVSVPPSASNVRVKQVIRA